MLLTVVGLLFIITLHTIIATIMVRFFRIRLTTTWGFVLFSLFLVPLALVASLLIVGQIPIFIGLDRDTVLIVTILLPMLLGFAIDIFWLPSPHEVELASRDTRR